MVRIFLGGLQTLHLLQDLDQFFPKETLTQINVKIVQPRNIPRYDC